MSTDSLSIQIEPLDTTRHDRSGFSCGVARLDNYLHRTARKQQANDQMRVWVARAAGERSPPIPVLGYYALAGHAFDGAELPSELRRGAGRQGSVPAAYLSMIAVSEAGQGRGMGRVLLVDAICRVADVADQLGTAALVLDAIDDGGPDALSARKRFYIRMGFRELPSQPSRMFLTTAQARSVRAKLAPI